MKSTKELLGGRIRELRKGLKMSQEQLSELVDVDPRYISRIELGKCFPSLEKLESIAHALKAEMRELFDYEHHDGRTDYQESISSIFEGVEDEHQKQLIMRITKAIARSIVNNI